MSFPLYPLPLTLYPRARPSLFITNCLNPLSSSRKLIATMHFNLLTALAVLSYTGLNMVHASHCVPTTVITCPRDSDEHPLNQPMAVCSKKKIPAKPRFFGGDLHAHTYCDLVSPHG